MAGRHLEDVPADYFDRRAVVHFDTEMSGDDVANVMDLAGLCSRDGPYMFRPTPPGLEDRTPDREFAELHQLDAGFVDSSHLVRMVKTLPAQLHNAIVRTTAQLSSGVGHIFALTRHFERRSFVVSWR